MLCKKLIEKAASKKQNRKKKIRIKGYQIQNGKYKYEKKQCELIKQNC